MSNDRVIKMASDACLDSKERFAFGKNSTHFLENLDQERISEAEKSLTEKLKTNCNEYVFIKD